MKHEPVCRYGPHIQLPRQQLSLRSTSTIHHPAGFHHRSSHLILLFSHKGHTHPSTTRPSRRSPRREESSLNHSTTCSATGSRIKKLAGWICFQALLLIGCGEGGRKEGGLGSGGGREVTGRLGGLWTGWAWKRIFLSEGGGWSV